MLTILFNLQNYSITISLTQMTPWQVPHLTPHHSLWKSKYSPHCFGLKLLPILDSPHISWCWEITLQWEKCIVKNAISSHCSHSLMLGMNWSGKLITTQESIHDREGSITLTAVLVGGGLGWVNVNMSSPKEKQPLCAKKPKANFLQSALTSTLCIQTGRVENQLEWSNSSVILKSACE